MLALRSALNYYTAPLRSTFEMQGSMSFLILACLTVARAVKLTKFSISAPEHPSKKVAAYVISISTRLCDLVER